MLLWSFGIFVLVLRVPVFLLGPFGRGVMGQLGGMSGFALYVSGWREFVLSVWVVCCFGMLYSLCSQLHQLWSGMLWIGCLLFRLCVVDVQAYVSHAQPVLLLACKLPICTYPSLNGDTFRETMLVAFLRPSAEWGYPY